jgi:hypothetical protein
MDGKIRSVMGIQQVLTTERLTLEPLRDKHAESIVELFTEPAMSTYLGMDFTRRETAEANGAEAVGLLRSCRAGSLGVRPG